MSRDDLECPYCGAGNEVNHDDGFGYEEGVLHEMQCHSCDKNFVFNTYISFSYEPYKADCLNGSQHQLKFQRSYPEQYSKMRCVDCEFERRATEEEINGELK